MWSTLCGYDPSARVAACNQAAEAGERKGPVAQQRVGEVVMGRRQSLPSDPA